MFPPHAEFFNILSTHDPQHPRGSKERGGGRLISIYYVDHPPTPQLSLIQGMSTGYTPLITLLLCYFIALQPLPLLNKYTVLLCLLHLSPKFWFGRMLARCFDQTSCSLLQQSHHHHHHHHHHYHHHHHHPHHPHHVCHGNLRRLRLGAQGKQLSTVCLHDDHFGKLHQMEFFSNCLLRGKCLSFLAITCFPCLGFIKQPHIILSKILCH